MSIAVAIASAVLALAQPPFTRRQAILGATWTCAGSAVVRSLPANAGLLIDPIGAYGSIPEIRGPVIQKNGKPNTGAFLLRDCFDGVLPAQGLVEWYEEHLTEDFVAEFAGGAIKLDKNAYTAVTAELLKAFPDFVYTSISNFKYADSPTTVTWTAVVKGTHSGAPFSPSPGVPPIAAKSPPIACQNDPEQLTAYFASGTTPPLTKLKRLRVETLPGGKGLSGPAGLYLQAGGDQSNLKP